MPSPLASAWSLDPSVTYLNHGSFGACPRRVIEAQAELRAELERQPVDFFVRRYPALLDGAREALGRFVGASSEGLVAVRNATQGVNTALRAVPLSPGDDVLTTDHAYNATRNALEVVAARAGARVVVASLPFPGASPEGVLEAILAATSTRTRLALIDHVTSASALVLPIERIVRALEARGVDVLVDGAHAPGMLDSSVERISPAFYAGNAHKWMCAPKGAAFLWIRPDLRDSVEPLVLSHGVNTPTPGRSRLHDLFDWTGTDDPTAFLSIPEAIRTIDGLAPGGWPEVRERNRARILEGRAIVGDALGTAPPGTDAMVGSMATLPLPATAELDSEPESALDPLQERLRRAHAIEVPIVRCPPGGPRYVRISAQLYNARDDYERLAAAIRT